MGLGNARKRARRAAIEKNRLLFAWKHFQEDDLVEHLQSLRTRLVEQALSEEREELVWFLLAAEQRLAPAGEAGRSIP